MPPTPHLLPRSLPLTHQPKLLLRLPPLPPRRIPLPLLSTLHPARASSTSTSSRSGSPLPPLTRATIPHSAAPLVPRRGSARRLAPSWVPAPASRRIPKAVSLPVPRLSPAPILTRSFMSARRSCTLTTKVFVLLEVLWR